MMTVNLLDYMIIYRYIFVAILSGLFVSCSLDKDNDKDKDYADWQALNDAFVQSKADETNPDGTKVYTKVIPAWNNNAYVLMRWFNDTTLTAENFRPLYTSTIDCKYIGRLYDNEPFDSSYNNITPADSIYRTKLTSVISGWTIAFERMHVGDSVEVIVPYQQGYGTQWSGSIPPYSALVFNIKLVDVVAEYFNPASAR